MQKHWTEPTKQPEVWKCLQQPSTAACFGTAKWWCQWLRRVDWSTAHHCCRALQAPRQRPCHSPRSAAGNPAGPATSAPPGSSHVPHRWRNLHPPARPNCPDAPQPSLLHPVLVKIWTVATVLAVQRQSQKAQSSCCFSASIAPHRTVQMWPPPAPGKRRHRRSAQLRARTSAPHGCWSRYVHQRPKQNLIHGTLPMASKGP